jgi:hypothetical protein
MAGAVSLSIPALAAVPSAQNKPPPDIVVGLRCLDAALANSL